MKKIQHFLWWCAGARIDILQLEECKNDHPKYFGIGGTIMFTALMASFAGGYAFFTAFQNSTLAVLFGIFWGGLIFNLDRYIVSTLKDDGRATISRSELINASPRIIMAILLGFVIATPLELKIFEPEIKTMVERLKIEKSEELRSRDSSFYVDLNVNKDRLTKLESDIQNYTNNKKKYLDNAVSYIEGRKNELVKDSKQKGEELAAAQNKLNTASNNYLAAYKDSTGKYSQGQLDALKAQRDNALSYRNKISSEKNEIDIKISAIESDKEVAIKEEAAKIDRQINLLSTEKETLIKTVSDMDQTSEKKRTTYGIVVKDYNGFAAHMEAMSTLASEESIIFWARLLITLLFIFIEVAPVLFKLMTESGPYDAILHRIKHEIVVAEKQKISDTNDRINTNVTISSERNKARLNAELKGNATLLEAIAKAQADIALKAVEKWKKKELKKLENSLSHIIQPDHDNQ